MLAIKNNLMAETAARQLGINYGHLGTSVSRLASGNRIVTSKDDAAGMAVMELIRADVATLRQGSRNAQDAISMLQTAEGALSVTDDILVRMKELAEQAATESYSSEQRKIMDEEFQQLISEIDRIANNTTFNSLNLLDSQTETFKIHLASVETIGINTKDMTSAGLGIGGTKSNLTMASTAMVSYINQQVTAAAGVFEISFIGDDAQTNVTVALTASMDTLKEIVDAINEQSRQTLDEEYDIASIVYDKEVGRYGIKLTSLYGSAENSIRVNTTVASGVMAGANFADADAVDGTGNRISIQDATQAAGALNTLGEAIESKDSYRARLGYLMNRLEAAVNVIDIQAENLLAAESRIADVDVAKEMAAMTRNQVLAQAGMSMLSQANSMPQMALSLLNG